MIVTEKKRILVEYRSNTEIAESPDSIFRNFVEHAEYFENKDILRIELMVSFFREDSNTELIFYKEQTTFKFKLEGIEKDAADFVALLIKSYQDALEFIMANCKVSSQKLIPTKPEFTYPFESFVVRNFY